MNLLLAKLASSLLIGTAATGITPPKTQDGETVGVPTTGALGVTETVEQIMDREKANPFVWDGRLKTGLDRDEWEHPIKKEDPRAPQVSQWPPAPKGSMATGRDHIRPLNPQPIGTEFNGILLSEAGFIPPDSTGDVSPTQIVVCANGRIKSFDKTGTLGALNVTMNTFFNSVRNASGISDPVVRYDRTSGRWFVSAFNSTTPNRIVLGVSNSSTITDTTSFTFYFFVHDAVGTTPNSDTGGFADYTKMGVDANAVVIGANIFNGAGTALIGTTAYVIRKSSVLSGGPIVVTPFRQLVVGGSGAGPWAPTGVDNDDPAATESYVIGVDNSVFSRIVVRRISTPAGTPTISGNLNITVPSTYIPINVPAQGSTTAMDSIDDRLFGARMTKNTLTGVSTLWCSHSIRVDTSGVGGSGGTRTASRFYQIGSLTTTPALVQSGTWFDSAASNPDYYWMSTVAMSGQGHMAMGASVASAVRFASVATAGRLSSDAAGTIQATTIVEPGTASYTLNDSFGRNRWGDYSHTTVDPTDNMTMWSFQEFANAANSWQVRVFKLIAPPPAAVTSLSPNTLGQGATANISVTGTSASGSGFYDPGAGWPNHIVAAFSGTGITVNSVTFTDPTHVTLNVTVGGAATTGLRNLTITNPDGQSATGTNVFTVTSGSNPLPTTTGISPTSKIVGDAAFTLTVNGTNFIGSSVVRFDGADRTTSFVNSTQVTCTIPATDMTTAGTHNITVFNPAPGGGTSNAQTFTVNNPVPTTTSISPTSKLVGDAAFTLTVNGTNFVNGAVVRFDGSNRTTTFVNSTQVTCTIPATDMTAAGTHNITVFNPAPGGGTSNAQTFTVNNKVPTTTSISPTSKLVGDATFTLTVNGTNFINGSVVRFDGSDRTTSFVSATQVTCTIPATDMTTAGTHNITVFNPTPGGGTSNAQTFTVNNPVPTTTSISPTSKLVGDATFTLTVNGTNFVNGCTVRFDGSSRTTSFVSSTQVTCLIPSTDMTAAGTHSITVFNPAPGGGTSNAQTFTVNNPVPTTTGINPAAKLVGSATFTMTVNGTNFVSGSIVRLNGSDRTTTFVNSTQVTASIPASDMTTAGTRSITVFNPTPGGGTSNAQTFSVNNPLPALISLSPTVATTLTPGLTLTVNGVNFISGSTVNWNGSPRSTTLVNSGQVTATILASDLAAVTTANVTVVNPGPGGGTSNTLTFSVVKTTFTGTVTLEQFVGTVTSVPVTFEIRAVGSTTPIRTITTNLNGSSQFTFQTDIAPGTYDITAKASHWLRKLRGSVVVNSATISGVNFSLKNGDCDGDNEVTLTDYSILSLAFGSVPGDGNWNPNADLDGDGEVTLADYSILAGNFGLAGDD